MYAAGVEALNAAESSLDVRSVIITGEGAHFSAGGNLNRLLHNRSLPPEHQAQSIDGLHAWLETIATFPKPVLAAVEGAAAGAGFSLALACDFRYADDSAKFKTAFINVGLPGDFGGHYFLPRIVGFAKARELYLLSPTLGAQQAQDLGMLTGLYSRENLESEVTALAQKLAKGPRQALALMKDNLNQALQNTLDQTLNQEAFNHVTATLTADHKEAAQAFIEKRPPKFER
jgi:2-(1,2-epoxy-1,2-dihydrophenyl)acetyl-CoA isomerase